jgi:hypothetical protein
MAFTVIERAGARRDFGNECRYEVHSSGALIVSDDAGTRQTYGPAGWLELRRAEPDYGVADHVV